MCYFCESPRGSTETTHIKHIRVKHTFDWGLGFTPAINDFTVVTCVYQPRPLISDLWSLIADLSSLVSGLGTDLSSSLTVDTYVRYQYIYGISRYLTSSIAASRTEYEMLSRGLTFLASLALQMLHDTLIPMILCYDMLHFHNRLYHTEFGSRI